MIFIKMFVIKSSALTLALQSADDALLGQMFGKLFPQLHRRESTIVRNKIFGIPEF